MYLLTILFSSRRITRRKKHLSLSRLCSHKLSPTLVNYITNLFLEWIGFQLLEAKISLVIFLNRFLQQDLLWRSWMYFFYDIRIGYNFLHYYTQFTTKWCQECWQYFSIKSLCLFSGQKMRQPSCHQSNKTTR